MSLTCHKPFKISKIDNTGPNARKKWERFELDGVTLHQCKIIEQQKAQQQQPNTVTQESELTKEVTAIKAQLLVLVNRLSSIEKELQK